MNEKDFFSSNQDVNDHFFWDHTNLNQKIFTPDCNFDDGPCVEELMTIPFTGANENNENEKLTKNKGRKPQNKEITKEYRTNILHSKENDDNIRRKIKCHFHNFIINYFNHLIKIKKKGNLRFKKIKYSYSLNDSIKFNQDLLQKKISEFFKLDISIKYKNYQKNENELVYEKLIKRFDNDVLKLFDLTYIQFYQNYYLNESLNLNNSKISNFYDLYKNEQKKELNENKSKYSDLLKLIAEQRFINYYFPNKIFRIEQKYDKETQIFSCKENENESQPLLLEDKGNESQILLFVENDFIF